MYTKVFASAVIVGMSAAQNSLISADQCCPTSCGSNSSKTCCTQCPTVCNTAPGQTDIIATLPDCKHTLLSWNIPSSCAPLANTEMQCQDRFGAYHNMPSVLGDRLTWQVQNSHLESPPFNLKIDQQVVCRVRAVSRCGKAPWATSNGVPLQECKNAPDFGVKLPAARKAEATRADCGLGGCVNDGGDIVNMADTIVAANNANKFDWVFPNDYFNAWGKGKSMNKLAAFMPMFGNTWDGSSCSCSGQAGCGCDQGNVGQEPVTKEPLPVTHKHSYKTKPQWKYEKKVVEWEEMEPKMEWRPVDEHFKKTIMVDRVVETPVTKSHTVKRTIKVEKIIADFKVKVNNVCRQVPESKVVAVTNDCACAKANCGCAGRAGCGCAAPACGCTKTVTVYKTACDDVATKVSTPRTVMVDKEIEVEVPTTYIKKETVKVPKVVDEIRTVQKAFEIEVPVKKSKEILTRVYVPQKEEKFYEHQHVKGGQEHVHGVQFIAQNFPNADPCGAKAKECALYNEVAVMATDAKCYCTKARH